MPLFHTGPPRGFQRDRESESQGYVASREKILRLWWKCELWRLQWREIADQLPDTMCPLYSRERDSHNGLRSSYAYVKD
jgi:hypothetical protein